MINSLTSGESIDQVMCLVSKRLKASQKEIFEALRGGLSESNYFALREVMRHIETLEAAITRFKEQLLRGLEAEHNVLELLQTIPGVDRIGAAMLIVSIDTIRNWEQSRRFPTGAAKTLLLLLHRLPLSALKALQ